MARGQGRGNPTHIQGRFVIIQPVKEWHNGLTHQDPLLFLQLSYTYIGFI